MYIKALKLNQFRNYETLELNLDPGTNIFYGNNAQGKTNILEAVCTCGTSRSHRGAKDKDMIRFGQQEAHIRMEVRRDEMNTRLDMHLRTGRAKGIAVNGLPIHRARELMGIVNLVFFSPEDLNIIKEGPSQRRKFLDAELCQLDKIYLSDLNSYNKVVMQRNQLIKDLSFRQDAAETLDIWDEQLLRYGKRLIEKRGIFVEELNGLIREIHTDITGGKEHISLQYEPDTEPEVFERRLLEGRERDLRMKQTGVGPHRDDLKVVVDGIDIRRFGSQGQQRSAALSLKLSELALVKRRVKDDPVLLLDDVLSELDSTRQRCLLERIHDIQTLMTCTGLDEFVQHRFALNRVFHVIDGTVDQ